MEENAYLIIHGFGGSTEEIEYLERYLHEKGLNTHTVLLAGHGAGKRELKKSSYVQWIASVEETVNTLKQQYRYIHLIGFSMGGLISAQVSSAPEIGKIVFVNTPIYFWNVEIIARDVVDNIRNKKFDKISYYKKSVMGASVKSGIDFLKILSKSKRLFKNIQNRALIVQCREDESVHFKSAQYIKGKMGDRAALRYYDGGRHKVFAVPELRDEVCKDIYCFLAEDSV